MKDRVEETLRLERKLTGERYDLSWAGLDTVDKIEPTPTDIFNHPSGEKG